MLIQMMKHCQMVVWPDGYLMPSLTADEDEDGDHKGDQVDHLMLQAGLLLMNSMEMSTGHLEVHVDPDDPDVEEEDVAWSTLMLSIPMKRMSVMMD